MPVATVTSAAATPFGGAAEVTAAGVSCARMANDDLYCWGTNPHGQTGTGVGTRFPLPVIYADGTPLHGVKRVLANYSVTCAFLNDGNLLCWGKNDSGQLGDGTFASRNYPAPIPLTCP